MLDKIDFKEQIGKREGALYQSTPYTIPKHPDIPTITPRYTH